MYNNTLQDLLAEQIHVRCEIAVLYGDLLKIMPPSKKIVSAAHDWSLVHIETMVKDLLTLLPNRKPPKNLYSEYLLMAGADPQQLTQIIGDLEEALHKHSSISTRIEQFGKGVA